MIRHFKQVTGKTEVDMHEVAAFAHKMGWPLPVPADPMDILARQFSDAAREETAIDSKTGKPYRINHAFTPDGNAKAPLWINIDEAPRKNMYKSAINRREQMVGDAYQLTLDLDHWNRVNPKEDPIVLPLDLGPDVEWRKNGDDDQAAA